MKKQMLAERYQLERKLGQNAGRQTWLAQDISLSPPQLVVVKLLAFNPQMHWDELKLFEREAQVLQHLNHPRIPEYRDFFAIEKQFGEGLPWFGLVQDYIPGDSLQALLDQGKRFTEAEVCQGSESILEILIYLHELSPPVFHRDIKPSNLILSQDGQVYLVDFGAVQDRATAEGVTFTVVGTSGYTPPEQLWGKVVPASDLYALGATLIHLLTGIAPADLPQHQMRLQFSDYVNLSPHFCQWLERLTEPAPERRFTGARQGLLSLKSGRDSQRNLAQSSRDRVRYGRLAGLTLLQFIIASIALSLILPNFWEIRQTQPVDTKDNVSLMNRTQVRVRLET
ncbi:serine/threonine protein kinase [Coleofasciculus sp.]|uniref:serine/threonine protein kinase n=1 Tax=Coleofasciculus sp. TaxID=3100458 RepID=UPI003A2037C7